MYILDCFEAFTLMYLMYLILTRQVDNILPKAGRGGYKKWIGNMLIYCGNL